MFRRFSNLLARSAALAAIICIAPAVELVDQNGRSVKFYDEVLKDNIVVISFIFTNCQSACPLMTRNLTMIRDMLREDERQAINFISISIDPLRDTPAAMKEFAQKHDADIDGWLWLTGQPDDVNFITQRLGSYTDDPEAHTTTLLAANVPNAHWTKIPPNIPPNGVVARLRLLVEENEAP